MYGMAPSSTLACPVLTRSALVGFVSDAQAFVAAVSGITAPCVALRGELLFCVGILRRGRQLAAQAPYSGPCFPAEYRLSELKDVGSAAVGSDSPRSTPPPRRAVGPGRYYSGTIGLPSHRCGTDCACAAAPTPSPTRSPTVAPTATPTVSGAHSPVPMR